MATNYNYLFQYLKKEQISIDRTEFEFQLQSHPDYPSLLAISDTLTFFNIENIAAKNDFDAVDELPDQFVARLFTESIGEQFYFITKNQGRFFYFNGKKMAAIARADLEKRWKDIVLFIEKSENHTPVKTYKKIRQPALLILLLLLTIAGFSQLQGVFIDKLFIAFPILGLLFSVAALRDLFGVKNELLNKFCNIAVSVDCQAVTTSSKWKVFKIINFSDLSIIFYAAQFAGLPVLLLLYDSSSYFAIQWLLIMGSVPVLFLSLYYQNFVERKWCPVCLAIMGIIVLEFLYLRIFKAFDLSLSGAPAVTFGIVFMTAALCWSVLRSTFKEIKEMKEFWQKGKRFMLNYELFRTALIASEKTDYQPLREGNLTIGNEKARLKITLVSNPFCNYCKDAHAMIEEILKKHKDDVCIDYRFNFNPENDDEQSLRLHKKLVLIYYGCGQTAFLNALGDWFAYKQEDRLQAAVVAVMSDYAIRRLLQGHYRMNRANRINFTPAIMINQYQFPKVYDKNDLIHFIDDFLEEPIE